MIDGMLLLWYVLTAGSVIFISWDLFTNTPTLGVMYVSTKRSGAVKSCKA